MGFFQIERFSPDFFQSDYSTTNNLFIMSLPDRKWPNTKCKYLILKKEFFLDKRCLPGTGQQHLLTQTCLLRKLDEFFWVEKTQMRCAQIDKTILGEIPEIRFSPIGKSHKSCPNTSKNIKLFIHHYDIFVYGHRPKTKELLELFLLFTFWFIS